MRLLPARPRRVVGLPDRSAPPRPEQGNHRHLTPPPSLCSPATITNPVSRIHAASTAGSDPESGLDRKRGAMTTMRVEPDVTPLTRRRLVDDATQSLREAIL